MSASTAQRGVDVGTKLIGEFVNDAYMLRIEARNSQLECRANITVHNTDNSIPPAELISILRNHDITTTVDLEQVAIFCTEAAQGEDPQQFLLAKGKEPVQGKDGWFELIVATGKEETDLVEDASGRVDFKSVQSFSNIEPGQQIGAIYFPTAGEPGKTITGEVIPSKGGKPSRVIAGSGVRISDDGTQAIAEQAGRAIFENNILSIAEEFVVNGDVDLSIGHISFNGFVDIKGDVLDDFNITATKGINITGAVGACRIEADGPVTIGTMAGMGSGLIRCKGDFKARYLNQVTIECWGDVQVDNEIRNSTIKSTCGIRIPKGLITGGRAIALEGIEAKIFGSKAGGKTHLTAGVYFPEADRLNYLRTRLKSVAYQLKKISDTLPLLHKKPLETVRKALREAIELRIDILTQRQAELAEERDELSEELTSFKNAEHPTTNPKINALGAIKEGVIISLGETTEEFKYEVNGPVTIIENSQHGGLRQLSHSPLKISAEKLEADALDAENNESETVSAENNETLTD